MPAPLLLDLSHSAHTRARTGVQRVSRALWRVLSEDALPVTFDPYEKLWRPLEEWELANLASEEPSEGRGATWPVEAQVRGTLRRVLRRDLRRLTPVGPGTGVVVPEIFSSSVAAGLPALFAALTGPKVAVFHDALALQRPQQAPLSTVTRFPSYLRELLRFDGVAAVSVDSREALLDYWRWLGVSRVPPVAAITLGIEDRNVRHHPQQRSGGPVVLCVGTLEGRKNHLALLDACEGLWKAGSSFTLRMVGTVNRETGAPALERIDRLRAAGRPLRYEGALTDAALDAAYAESAFTVYPSLAEGFGLPIAESLARGRVCLCRRTGALGELAEGGGCLDIGGATAPEIAAALSRLLASPEELAGLEAEARTRRFKTWGDYADELQGWMATLRRQL